MKSCPVCGAKDTTATVRRARLPVLQNRVYATRAEAIASPCAPFELHTCSVCGFSFNGRFDSALVIYDEHYDNDVPSAAFMRYYEELADRLIARFDLRDGTVYDIGCGKGTFLSTLCRRAPGIRGVGVDPSCTPITSGNFTMIKDVFRPEIVREEPRLLLLRHVLEHIDQPVEFLAQIASAAPHAPLFIEVPELNWIFENGTFWDFCYEHCNYFTAASLTHALARAGYEVGEQIPLFAGQFQGAISFRVATPALHHGPSGASAVAAATAYASAEEARMASALAQVERAGGNAVLWGMATKGVVFATLIGPEQLAGGVDINPKKQGRFAPGSGSRINPPDWLRSIPSRPTVFIMNGNYAAEIRRTVSDSGVEAQLVEL